MSKDLTYSRYEWSSASRCLLAQNYFIPAKQSKANSSKFLRLNLNQCTFQQLHHRCSTFYFSKARRILTEVDLLSNIASQFRAILNRIQHISRIRSSNTTALTDLAPYVVCPCICVLIASLPLPMEIKEVLWGRTRMRAKCGQARTAGVFLHSKNFLLHHLALVHILKDDLLEGGFLPI